jgi:Piwi domain
MNSIQLNFLAVQPQDFEFEVFRKPYEDQHKVTDPNLYFCNLPPATGKTYKPFLVSFTRRAGFTSFICKSRKTNNRLTVRFLRYLLVKTLRSQNHNLDYEYDETKFRSSIDFIIERLKPGNRVVTFEPYYLKSAQKFGFLINYRFRKDDEFPFNREVQRLSLSLDRSYRANTKYYTEKFHILRNFIVEDLPQAFPLVGSEAEVGINLEFEELNALKLDKKIYLLRGEKKSMSQFMGLKQHGPYTSVEDHIHYVFIFEKRFRDFANDIYLGLLGKKYGGLFPGLRELFGLNIHKTDVTQVPVSVYTQDSLDAAFQQILKIKSEKVGKRVVGVFITPKQEIPFGDTTTYYYMKHLFAGNGLALQFINYEHLSNTNTLKWSLANIGLQIFAKLGGIPWRVKPSNEKCLILGMGSAHRVDSDGNIQKYFGYSVCLDSSGVYKKINVLAFHQDKTKYLKSLREELVSTILSDVGSAYKKCVLHLPFKIQKEEIDAIRQSVREVSTQTNVDFRVIKINTENKFFGFSSHNTRIPYESTYVRLSYNEYLAWFEGLQSGKENVHSKIGNPVHLQFLREEDETDHDDRSYLQDIINLSGANWRGFNSKLVPISIYYSSLIAGYAKEFEEIDDLETVKNEISNVKSPWFL